MSAAVLNEDLLPIMSTSFSHEPPGKEVTYFFVIVVILGAVIQPLCNAVAHYTASETKSSRRNDKGTKRKLLYCPFFFLNVSFTSASMHDIPFHTQTNIHPVVDMKMLLDPAQTHVNGIFSGVTVHFFFF